MAKLRAIPEPVKVKWSDEIRGEHQLVFMWDESLDEIAVNVLSGSVITCFTLTYHQAQRVKRLIEWHEQTQQEAVDGE